ncbi:Kinesin-like protein KIF18A [Cricetulus griseus]|uniref:Kinesin-like protein KIF18A n=1 Tax=Cricetulus griseus TaxID=10029 RepID=G3HAM8_CRIGR|nr:Kinesin-like protein KIF18A [Cricetulus griseus]
MEDFEHTTKPILHSFLNGDNCTVLADGTTGAGKTHMMLGSAADPGVTHLTMLDLFKAMHEPKEEKVCSTAVSYLEVYNEQNHDLLTNLGPLTVQEDAPKRSGCSRSHFTPAQILRGNITATRQWKQKQDTASH